MYPLKYKVSLISDTYNLMILLKLKDTMRSGKCQECNLRVTVSNMEN